MSEFTATPTMGEFMLSKKYVRLLAGPVGGGKSVCCLHELFRWATYEQQPNAKGERKTRFLIVRNTADQLRSTVQKSLFDWFPPGIAGEWKATEKTMYFDFRLADGTRVKSEWMLLALDTPDDIRKALSLEATGLWGNECRELHPDVVDALLGRVNRYPSMKDGGATRSGAIFDTNMPDEDTWWFHNMETPPKNWSIHVQPPAIITHEDYVGKYGEDPDEVRTAEAFDGTVYAVDPESDNYKFLHPTYYPNLIPGKSQDYLDVYLRCRYGRALGGYPVYDKTFRADFHVSPTALMPVRSETYPLTIGLDFGRTPAAAIMQMAPGGRVHILSEVTSENMGIETFLTEKLRPHLYERYNGCPVVIAPDPAGWQKTQVGEISPVDVLKRAGFKVLKPPTNKPSMRIEAVENLLMKQIDGKAALLIDPSCTMLIKGFRYGYRWKANKKGDMEGQSPEKNEYSHCVVEGTRILTPNGEVPIEQIRVGDLVTTPFGDYPVTATMFRDVETVVEIACGDKTLTCTEDHPVYTEKGIALAGELQYNDVLLTVGDETWAEKRSTNRKTSTGSASTESPRDTTRRATRTAGSTCTASSGSFSSEKFLKGATSIIKTAIKQTTVQKIWSALLHLGTRVTTRVSGLFPTRKLPFEELLRRGKQQSSGTRVKQGDSGTPSTGSERGKTENRKNAPASSVAPSTAYFVEQVKKDIAALRARAQRGEPAASTTKIASVQYAEMISELIGTRKLARVQSPVGVWRCPPQKKRVFDLTVAGAHCFFANGLLTSNCHDALQYGSLMVGAGAYGGTFRTGRVEVKPAPHRWVA